MKTIKSKCAVKGNLGRVGKHFAMCGYISVGDKHLCGLPANEECEHKVRAENKESEK